MVVNEVEHTLIQLFRFLGNVTTLVTILSTSVLVVIVMWLVKQRKQRGATLDEMIIKVEQRVSDEEEVSTMLLRFGIIIACDKAIRAEYVTSDDLERINLAYSLYSKRGGNGYASQLVNRVNSLPIKHT